MPMTDMYGSQVMTSVKPTETHPEKDSRMTTRYPLFLPTKKRHCYPVNACRKNRKRKTEDIPTPQHYPRPGMLSAHQLLKGRSKHMTSLSPSLPFPFTKPHSIPDPRLVSVPSSLSLFKDGYSTPVHLSLHLIHSPPSLSRAQIADPLRLARRPRAPHPGTATVVVTGAVDGCRPPPLSRPRRLVTSVPLAAQERLALRLGQPARHPAAAVLLDVVRRPRGSRFTSGRRRRRRSRW